MKYLILFGVSAGVLAVVLGTYRDDASPRLVFGDIGREPQMPFWEWTIAQFSPDGNYILACTNKNRGVAKLWDTRKGTEVRAYEVPVPDFRSGIRAVGFSPNGKHVYALAPGLVAWDRENGNELFKSSAAGTAIAVTPDGTRILVGVERSLALVNAEDGNVLKRISDGPEFPNAWAQKIHIPRDGKWLVFDTGNEISVWDLGKMEMIILGHDNPWGRKPKNQFRLPEKHAPLGFAISPDGKGVLIPTSSGAIIEVDYTTGREKKRYQLEGERTKMGVFTVSPKGDKVMTSDLISGDTRIYSFPECKELKRISGYGNVQFSPDGKTALTFTKDGRMMLWDLE